MERVSNRGAALSWAILAIALMLLNASLTFVNVWPTPRIRLTWDLSVEAAACVLLVVVARSWFGVPSRAVLRSLGVILSVLVVGRYVDVTAQSLYGRDINLYWDLRLMPDVGAMLAFVAQPWLVVATLAGAILLPLLIYAPLRWAVGRIADATNEPRARRTLTALAGGVLLLFATGSVLRSRVPWVPRFAEPVTPVYIQEISQFAYELTGAGVRSLPPPTVIEGDLANVKGADVFLIFIESYGAVSWDRPEFATALARSRERLTADIRDTGRDAVSAFVESPTFGGESWLAHVSLLSGTEVRDEDTNQRLMGQQRETMVTAFSRQGYRTVAVMPGLQHAWPQGAFYGFDDTYGTSRLGYQGPPFGWWDITDQYTVARLDALAVAPQPRAPVFVFFPTISTHTPFTPTPPYQPDWTRALTTTPYDQEELDRAWSQWADWLNLGPAYTQSLDYVHAWLGGYLRLRHDRDFVMMLVGDHQPPAMVTGEDASWNVPVHIVTSRRAVLDGLLHKGFRQGLTPQYPALGKMNELLPILLDAFSSPRPQP
jgi:hypothetical protein